MSIAAALILIVGMSLRYYQSSYLKDDIAQYNEIDDNFLSEEFIETNQYFSQQMNEEIENIKCKLPYTDENNRKQLVRDIDELLKNNESFIAEIQQSQDEELAINFLVQHYRTNIATLEFINEKLGKYIKCWIWKILTHLYHPNVWDAGIFKEILTDLEIVNEKQPTRIEKKEFDGISSINLIQKYGNVVMQEGQNNKVTLEIHYFDVAREQAECSVSKKEINYWSKPLKVEDVTRL